MLSTSDARKLPVLGWLVLAGLLPTVVAAAGDDEPAIQVCECKCAGEPMKLGDVDAAQCRGRNGAPCLASNGKRGALDSCELLFVSPVSATPEEEPEAATEEANAQPSICEDGETWAQCSDRALEATPIEEEKEAIALAEKPPEERKKVFGEARRDLLLGAATPSGASANKSFIQRLLVALDIPGLIEKDGLLSFKYHTPGEIFGFEAKANEPKLFDKLEEALPVAEREARTDALSKQLGPFDDVTYGVSINVKPKNTLLGSGKYEAAAELLVEDVSARSQTRDAAERDARTAFRLALRRQKLSLSDSVEKAGGAREELERALNGFVAAARANDEAYLGDLKGAGLFTLADLAANQPQFSFTAEARVRDDLIGADTLKGTLSWEIGFGANLNALNRECPNLDVACYSGFLRDVGDLPQRKWRLNVEAAYEETDEYDSPIADATLHIDKVESLIAKATFGGVLRYEEVDGKTVEQNSFAAEASYEDVTGDAARQSRLVATATLNQRLSDDFSAQISVVWANKPEYRGDVDDEWSTTAGLRYKLNGKPKT